MPVTAKLSRHFYEQLGDDVANELVEWFNAVDATYKAELRQLNDRNWERFRAEMRAQFAEFRTEVNSEFARVRAEMDRKFAELRFDARLAELRAELLKWMFVFWAGTVIPIAALVVGLAVALR